MPHRDASEHLLSWMDNSEKPSSSQRHPPEGREAVPALEVPLSHLQYQEDEMLSWLQYPLEDSFDKNYCSEELYTETPTTHSSFVNDAFSNLTLRDRGKLHSSSLRSHTSLPSGHNIRERGAEGDAPAAMCATHKGERVLAANTAMAMGAQRAAGLLFQSGAEAFNTVRTNAQPDMAKRPQNAIPIQETGGSVSNFMPCALTRSKLQPPFHHLTSPNFPLFSRAVGITKTSLHNNSTGGETSKLVSSTHAKGGDFAFKCDPTTGKASLTVEAHPTREAKDIPSKGISVCFSQSSATGGTGIGSSNLPFQCETRRKPFIAHPKEALVTSVTESTKIGTISCKLEAEAIGLTHVEGTSRALGTPCAERALHIAAGATVASPGFASSTATTDMDSSLHSELARHDSGTSQNLASSGIFLHAGITTSESKLCETVETGDATMASPSRESGDSTDKSIKEAAAFTMKRKAHPTEDSEIESKVVLCKDGKLPQGSTRGGKRTRAAEIHNLSERKRRNKINVKMKALQDLIPNANKTDKASILDEAIEYMKLLQSQVQLMSLRTGMVGMPMVLPPGIPSSSMQQTLPPPHSNRMGVGSGMLDAAPGYFSAAPAVGHPLSGSAYSGLQLVGSHAGIQETHGHLQSQGGNDAYTFLPVHQQQQHWHWNTHTMFGAYITQQQQQQQQQQQPSQFQLSARETPRDAMQ